MLTFLRSSVSIKDSPFDCAIGLAPSEILGRQSAVRRAGDGEMIIPIVPADQSDQGLVAIGLAHAGSDVADRRADPPVFGSVGAGGMEQMAMVKRRLTQRKSVTSRSLK